MPKSDINKMLDDEPKKPTFRRGKGFQLSTEEPATTPSPAELNSRATSTNREITNSSNRTQELTKPKRIKRGYELREDLIKAVKRAAVDEDRSIYEIIEEAIESYLRNKQVG